MPITPEQQDVPASEFLGTNDVQVVSQDQGVSADQFFGAGSSTPAAPPTGFAANKAEFAHPSNFFSDTLRGLVDPSYKATSFVGGLAQNTVGSRGVVGTLEQAARTPISFMLQPATDAATQSRQTLATATLHAVQTARNMPDGFKKDQLLQVVQDNMNTLGITADDLKQLNDASETSRQAFGNTLNAATTLYGGGSAGASAKLLPRMAEGAAIGAAGQTGFNLSNDQPTTKGVAASAAIGAAIPFVGTMLSKLKQGTGKGIQTLGEKIQTSTIRPSIRDVEDGFKVETIKKYDLGGSLNTTLEKTNAKMNELGGQLRSLADQSNAKVNLNDVYTETKKQLLSGSTAKNFGQNARIENVLSELKNETKRVASNGTVDVATAQDVKRAAGTMGSWVYGFADKDSSATETVYTKFYQNLKKAVENTDVGPEMKAVNQQLQELIPVHNAVVRRIPVAERQNAVSFTDVMGLLTTVVHPKAATITAINKGSKSGVVGDFLSKLGSKLQPVAPSVTNIGKRIFGR